MSAWLHALSYFVTCVWRAMWVKLQTATAPASWQSWTLETARVTKGWQVTAWDMEEGTEKSVVSKMSKRKEKSYLRYSPRACQDVVFSTCCPTKLTLFTKALSTVKLPPTNSSTCHTIQCHTSTVFLVHSKEKKRTIFRSCLWTFNFTEEHTKKAKGFWDKCKEYWEYSSQSSLECVYRSSYNSGRTSHLEMYIGVI